ncbi:hypothetical protein Tco_1550600 [Tanacetum coccineum]
MVARLPKTGWLSLSMFLEQRVASPRGYGSWVFVFTKASTSPRVSSYLVKAYQIYLCCCKDWKLLLRDVAASFAYAVHRVHAVSFDAAIASTVSSDCYVAAGYIVCCCCLLCSCYSSILLLREDLLETWN